MAMRKYVNRRRSQDKTPDPWMTVHAAHKEFGITRPRLYRKAAAQEIRSKETGSHLYLHRDDVAAMVA